MPVVLTIKRNSGEPSIALDALEPETTTVAQVKEAIAATCDVQADKQRLIFSGRILKNGEQTLSSYGIKGDASIHMVVPKVAVAPTEPEPTPAAAASNAAAPATQPTGAPAPSMSAPATARGSNLQAERARQLMEQLRANPMLLRQIIMQHPELMENPDIRALRDDPDNVSPEAMERFQQMVQRLMDPAQAQQPTITVQQFSEMMTRVMAKLGLADEAAAPDQAAAPSESGPSSAEPHAASSTVAMDASTVAMDVDGSHDAAPEANPDEFKEEIAMLEGMGFSNRPMNLMALRSVGGSVQEALELLLAQGGMA